MRELCQLGGFTQGREFAQHEIYQQPGAKASDGFRIPNEYSFSFYLANLTVALLSATLNC